MKIRKAEISDAEAIMKINVDTWQQAYRGLMPDDVLEQRVCSPERAERWRKNIKKTLSGATTIYVAEDENGRLAGFVWGGESRDGNVPRHIELYAFYVHPEAQKKGYGKALFEAFRKYAAGKFYLYMLEGNKQAQNFYKRTGGVLMPQFAKESSHSGSKRLKEVCWFFE